MKNNKARENETLSGLNSFTRKLNQDSKKGWMSE
jgi:hypothetical protein